MNNSPNQLLIRKIFILLLGFIFAVPNLVLAQFESGKWVFGYGAGVDFTSGHPVSFVGSKMKTTEGCSVISDSKGNLLFYTDGVSVWNKNNVLMPAGNNLNGNFSSTQSAIIVPKPESKTLFYIFTMDWEANKGGFCYSLVDMTKEQGLGNIIQKNQLINELCTEKLIATKHANNKDIWVIIHEFNSNAFLAYLLTKNGLSQNPVISNVGIKYKETIYNTIGYMKLSTDKKRLAVAVNGDRIVQIFDFDQKTGLISNPVTITFDSGFNPYGVEFSPNSDLLYIGLVSKGMIYQVNLKAGNESDIQKSMTLIGKSSTDKVFGALQLGIDGKIYIAEYQSRYLSSITNPNIPGKGCSFKSQALFLNTNTSMLGLPVFYQDYIKQLNPNDYVKSDNAIQKTSTGSKNTEVNKKQVLNNVYFDFNKATLKNNFTEELKQLADYLNKNTKLTIEIIGHTDSIGSTEYNNRLSLVRAKQIGAFLIEKGIEKSRITYDYKGSSEPVAPNNNESGRQKNRRVEFILKDPQTP